MWIKYITLQSLLKEMSQILETRLGQKTKGIGRNNFIRWTCGGATTQIPIRYISVQPYDS